MKRAIIVTSGEVLISTMPILEPGRTING
jgi:hypothetical protein